MEAAKAAARAFVERQPTSVVIGVVAFSDAGLTVQAPTSDQAAVLASIDRLTPTRGTSLATGSRPRSRRSDRPRPATHGLLHQPLSPDPTPAPTPGAGRLQRSAAIVLLSDGENTVDSRPGRGGPGRGRPGGPDLHGRHREPAGVTLEVNGFRVHTQLDEEMLQQIADATDGSYYHAIDAAASRCDLWRARPAPVGGTESIELTARLRRRERPAPRDRRARSLLWLGRLP